VAVPEPSFRQTLRRRVAPVAFLLAVAFLASRTCTAQPARIEIQLALGAAAAHVDTLRVDVFAADDALGVASFERHIRSQPVRGPIGFEASLDPGSYRLHIEARTGASTRTIERVIVVGEQLGEHTVISVDLEQALLPAPGAD
jgi:hypothetical protein